MIFLKKGGSSKKEGVKFSHLSVHCNGVTLENTLYSNHVQVLYVQNVLFRNCYNLLSGVDTFLGLIQSSVQWLVDADLFIT